MVKIIALKGSPVDLINAGLTAREFMRNGKEVSFQLIDNNARALNKFWKKPQDHVDSKDKTLVIINLPLSDLTVLKEMEPSWEAAIMYVPSKLISLDKDRLDVLLEKGISCTPQREPYLCFAGNLAERTDELWTEIGKIVSLENIPDRIEEQTSQIIDGLLSATYANPQLAVRNITENNIDYFRDLAKEEPRVEVHVDDPDLVVEEVLDSNSALLPEIACEAFRVFLKTRKRSIGICGQDESAVFSIKPTSTQSLLSTCNVKGKVIYYLGKGAIFSVNDSRPTHIGVVVGRDARQYFVIRFTEPKHVSYKTLKRRLIGGQTRYHEGGREYVKTYHGLKEKYPDISLLSRTLLKVPQDSFEVVIDTLKESGSSYNLIQ